MLDGGWSHFWLWNRQPGVEQFQGTTAQHGQRPVRGHTTDRLVVVKVIAELGHLGLVGVAALTQPALKDTFLPQPLAQFLQQGGLVSPAFTQNIAHPVQHRRDAGEVVASLVFVGLDKGHGLVLGRQRGVRPQQVSQWLKPGFAGNLAFGAALLLEGQVQVFQRLLGGGRVQGCQQTGRHLALLFNTLHHGLQPGMQFPQVAQAGLELAQLNVVQAACGLLAVTGNERNSGATVEQVYRHLHLGRGHPNFLRNLRHDMLHEG